MSLIMDEITDILEADTRLEEMVKNAKPHPKLEKLNKIKAEEKNDN